MILLVTAAEVVRAIAPDTAIVDEEPGTIFLVRPFLNCYRLKRGSV
jgi:hypothetical protein